MNSIALTSFLFCSTLLTAEAAWGCYKDRKCTYSAAVCGNKLCNDSGGSWTSGCTSGECICTGTSTRTFTAKVDTYAGELGYYSFDECPDQSNPTIGIQKSISYTFDQSDKSNYYHPLGFAYFPDGAHDTKDELEPGIGYIAGGLTSTAPCATKQTCPAPMYFKNNTYLGAYSNDATIIALTENIGNFGLDEYEPLFFHPLPTWMGYGKFEVKLKWTETEITDRDLFYFCHIHQGMSGRIKFVDTSGVAINPTNNPALGYSYDYEQGTSDFDKECGTFDLFKSSSKDDIECPPHFVCKDSTNTNQKLNVFATCVDAMNCDMLKDMTTKMVGGSEENLFLYQMIPHHENAVNMAKALIKTKVLDCSAAQLTAEEPTSDCTLEMLSREIISNQNAQIQTMKGLLEANQLTYPNADNDCKVTFSREKEKEISSANPCFSSSTTAVVKGHGGKTMDEIKVGDEVLTGSGEFKTVYSIDHRDLKQVAEFLQISYGSPENTLEITPKHMIFLQGKIAPVASSTVNIGDKVMTSNGAQVVTSVSMVERKGVFNPLTLDGTIVASGIVSSTFSALLSNNEWIEVAGHPIMTHHSFFMNLVYPYKFLCTTVSLDLCKLDNEKVLVSEVASKIFYLHNGEKAVYQSSLLSFAASLVMLMNFVVVPLVYCSIPVMLSKAFTGRKVGLA